MTSHWENVLTPAGDGGWPEVTRRRDLGRDDLRHLDLRWRAANYLSVGQIYLMDNPLLREPLRAEHVKPRLLGHWGTTPGLNFIHAHLNRAIVERDVEMMHVMGPGHGGPAAVASSYLDGTWSEIYPDVGQDEDGLRKLFRQFSFPGGIPSHAAPEVPGSIHEGGELGYSISHAFGAAFDNPDLVVATVVGDGEAETGPLATSWHSTKFLDPRRDGAVLPILHLNGYKIANPTVLSAIAEDELWSLLRGGGWAPYVVAGSDPEVMHHSFATTLDHCLDEIASIQHEAREAPAGEPAPRRPWPMIVLRSPKGWTGPGQVDGDVVEDHWRAHQVPFKVDGDDDDHLQLLEQWLRSYRPEELFDAAGHVIEDVTAISPAGNRRMSASPHANGGLLRRELDLPDFTEYAVEVGRRGGVDASATGVLAGYLRDTLRDNDDAFRIFAPDELGSNRLDAVLEATDRTWNAALGPHDTNLSPGGRVMEVLSEHLCQGWLEGYLLTGRHGLFTSYEAFAHIVGSMFNQHAKWIDAASDLPWRRPISSFTYLLTSHVWRQDHNGFTHQDPGFIDHVVTKKADVVRVYLPPDANTLLTVADRCLRSQDRVNVVVAGKQEALQYLPMSEAVDHVERGIGAWSWASNDDGDPDVVMACAGDIATMETLAAVSLLHEAFPQLRVRVVNVVDLMRLQDDRTHPHGLSDDAFDDLFTTDRPIIMAYHGYPWLIHRLTHRRTNHANLHVHGYVEEGTTTTPFDMSVRNGLDRFHLVLDVIDRVPDLPDASVHAREMREHLRRHGEYVTEHGDDMPEVRNWRWPGQ